MSEFGTDEFGARLAELLTPGALAEVTTSRESIVKAAYMDWRREVVLRSDGSSHTRYTVGHPGAVAILAIDAANVSSVTLESPVMFVRQFRTATGRLLLEIPAGTLDIVNGQREAAGRAAVRELEEETGLIASDWQHLRSFYTAPGFTDEWMELHLALGLRPAGEGRRTPDHDEALEPVRLTVAEAVEGVQRGAIVDAKSLIAVSLAERLASGRRP
ncbi:MAG: NUDIX hydrolase [Candidatus Limnocylindrus sp.]